MPESSLTFLVVNKIFLLSEDEICWEHFRVYYKFYRFSRGCKLRENLWNCSRKYPEMFKTDFIFRQQKIKLKPECLAWSCHYATGCFVAFFGDISILKSGWNMKKLFCCPALELFHCLPLWKTVLFVSSRAFSLSTPTFLLSTPVDNSEATWKKATKCNKVHYRFLRGFKPRENLWSCWRKYPKMFKTDFIFRQQNIEFKPECQA